MDWWQVPHAGDVRYQTTACPVQTHLNPSLPVITCFLAMLAPLPYFALRDLPFDFFYTVTRTSRSHKGSTPDIWVCFCGVRRAVCLSIRGRQWLFRQWPADANRFYLGCRATAAQRSDFTAVDSSLSVHTNTHMTRQVYTIYTRYIKASAWVQMQCVIYFHCCNLIELNKN